MQVGTESYKLKPLIKGSKKGSLAPPAEQTLGHDNAHFHFLAKLVERKT